MPTDILMPAFSPTMERGNLIQWVKAIGDSVRVGDIIAEVETDKATMDVESAVEGVLIRILIPGGTRDVPVNKVIGLIGLKNEMPSGFAAPAIQAHAEQAIATPPAPASAVNGGARKEIVSASSAATPIGELGDGNASRILASPIARRLMREAALNIASIEGTGPRRRIIERDVIAALAAHRRVQEERAALTLPDAMATIASSAVLAIKTLEPKAQAEVADPRALFEPGSFTETSHDTMQLTIARRLSEAKRTVPHFYLSADCAIDALLALRAQFNGAAEAGTGTTPAFRLSVNDFVIKALALALMKVPDANVSFTADSLLRHRHADIAVAVSIQGGLVTPIVRHAETRTLSAISTEMKDLAARARHRKLKPEEYQGGTSSVSNLGMHGVRNFAAVLNPPQATILAVGAAERRIVVRDDAPAVANAMTVTLSVDHRAVNGETAAKLLTEFKRLIEEPITMVV